jgi:hypothetical protein
MISRILVAGYDEPLIVPLAAQIEADGYLNQLKTVCCG